MRNNAANIRAILNNDNVGLFAIAKLNWNSDYYFTDIGHDVVFDGHTYTNDMPLVGMDAPQYSAIVNREAFTFTVSGLDPIMRSEFEQGIVGMDVEFRIMFTVDGVPATNVQDTFELYAGRVSKTDLVQNEDEQLINIECTAPFASLEQTGTLFTTKDGISALEPTDTSFDQVSESSNETSQKWGKL